jgi:ABC-type polysaccharide/polyol phosphate export permease
LVNLGLSLVPLVGLVLLLRQSLYLTWMFVPVAALLMALFALGVALLVSTLAVFFVDVADLYQVLLQALFFLTPIMYPKAILPPAFQWVLQLNPLYYLVELFRESIYAGQISAPPLVLVATVISVTTLLLGWWVYTRKAEDFVYRI